MEIYINNIQDYSKKEQTIVIKENYISLINDKSCFEVVLSKDVNFVTSVCKDLEKIVFDWKNEYDGGRKLTGEKYHIVIDANHHKKKYKIQNKFPSNWEEFLLLKKRILEVNDNE